MIIFDLVLDLGMDSVNGRSHEEGLENSSVVRSQQEYEEGVAKTGVFRSGISGSERPKWVNSVNKVKLDYQPWKNETPVNFSRDAAHAECTFHPKISKRSIDLLSGRLFSTPEEIYKRNQEWAEQKERVLEEKRKRIVDPKVEECTFTPSREVEILFIHRKAKLNWHHCQKKKILIILTPYLYKSFSRGTTEQR